MTWPQVQAGICRSLAFLLLATLGCMPAMAQTTASQLTPRDLRPEPPSAAPAPVLEPSPAEAQPGVPEGMAELRVIVGEVAVEQGFEELSVATARLTESFKGRSSNVGELYALASAVEALYSRAGYFLARVTIPPQNMEDGGTFRLLVIDGYLESLNLDAVPERYRPLIENRLSALLHQPRLKNADIEQALILAGRTPGLALRSTLMAGEKIGAARLVLEGQHDLFAGSLTLDNRLSEALGPWQSTVQLQANQPFAKGEQFYMYVSGDPNPVRLMYDGEERRISGAGVSWPLGSRGTSLNLEITASDTYMPSPHPLIPSTSSHFERRSLRLSHPLRVTRRGEVSVTGSYEQSRQSSAISLFAFEWELNRDELRVLRLSVNGHQQVSPSSRVSLFAQASQGLKGNSQAGSRPGADPHFAKLELTLGWQLALPWQLQLASTLRAQQPFGGPLPSAELFGLDGESALSSLVSGGLADDGGWTLREELGRGFPVWNDRLMLAPYVFVVGGVPHSEGIALVDWSSAAGAGLRGSSGRFSLSMEYGNSRVKPGSYSENEFFAKAQVVF